MAVYYSPLKFLHFKDHLEGLDGNLYATRYDGPTGQTYMGGSDPLIGAEYHSTSGGYYGEIGLIQAYNRALSGPEILTIFNQTRKNYINYT